MACRCSAPGVGIGGLSRPLPALPAQLVPPATRVWISVAKLTKRKAEAASQGDSLGQQ